MKRNVSRLVLPHEKATALMQSVVVTDVQKVVMPLSMHSGKNAIPVVSVGDHVYVGQLIAKEDGDVSSPVHASVSGTVTAIEPVKTMGKTVDAIVIASDGKNEKDPSIKAPVVNNVDEFLQAVRDSGLVGLGGAAFPTLSKLAAVKKAKINTFLINGAECEPYLTSDTRTMMEDGKYIEMGIEYLRKYTGAEKYVIGIEKNKPEAIALLKERFAKDDSVVVEELDSYYPQGAKQVLLYNVTGKVQKPGTRLADLGVLIINVTSLAKLAKYMEDGMPLIDRCVTVDGSAVNKPGNFVVPIGTPISKLFELAGGLTEDVERVIIGGPMMGHAVEDLDEPVVKATGGVLAFNKKQAKLFEPSACIHCGRCVENCPLSLNPTEFARAMTLDNEEEKLALLKKEQVTLCMQCGCCSYVCPAHRPLVQTNVAAISFVKKHRTAR